MTSFWAAASDDEAVDNPPTLPGWGSVRGADAARFHLASVWTALIADVRSVGVGTGVVPSAPA